MSQPIYRPLFLKAWKITWHHKHLWLLGIFASFMAAGGLFEAISSNWRTASTGQLLIQQTLNGTIPGYQWLISYSRYLTELSPVHQYLLIFWFLALLAFFIIFGALCQGAILNSALEKKPIGFKELLKNGWRFFSRIIGLDILGKLGVVIIFFLSIVPSAFLNPLPYGWYKFPPLIAFVIFLVGALLVTILQMLALVAVVHKHQNLKAAIIEAWHIFRLHFLVAIEMGILLFVTSLIALAATLGSFFILAVPITLFFVIATATASPAIYTIAIIFAYSLVLATIFLIFGWLTAFQYTVWSLFFEEMERFGIVSWIKRRFKK
ncbi:MAG: hypothetical protein V1664_04425 [Candidatus Uhrbacteria bacterium]